MYYLLGALALFFGEEQVKSWVERSLILNKERPLLKNYIILTKHHNYGFAHNRCSGKKKRVLGVSAAGLFSIAIYGAYGFFSDTSHIRKTGMMLLLAGGLSNTFDRFKRSYVVDYFIINRGRLKKTIFNLADIMLFTGCAVCAVGSLFSGGKDLL